MAMVKRWALWCKAYGFYCSPPGHTEALFASKESASAARRSASVYNYEPIEVELRYSSDDQESLDPADPLVSISESFLTNIDTGKTSPPEGEDWVAILFCKKRSGKDYTMSVHGKTLKERDAAVRKFSRKHKLVVVPEPDDKDVESVRGEPSDAVRAK